ncbi:MAG TPA: chemotaxis-specific protein-glutamate methyltransferase CheB [Oscillatoriales cyanobacterium M59_W2019_021]|nr:chemotaxis-specific protein-glutamate methyltransferase CheB [Oscillatoriales cyanobacterium M4454_W2019_049]HIK50911.1 chemotaxis-specific protein-glutamate methyltransferase CheB [Oscillatoriales cyanobacterium M59_W2019_021]
MPIQVLLVDDSPVVLTILKRLLDSTSEIEVAGTARTAREALALIPRLQPQVICTDLKMPGMDGLDFIREVMANDPRPILVLSASVQPRDTENVFRLLAAGAVDVLPKPIVNGTADLMTIKQELITKIKVLAGVAVFKLHRRSSPQLTERSIDLPSVSPSRFSQLDLKFSQSEIDRIEIVGIGASTGGPQALRSILSEFPENFPVPAICVQHISSGFLAGLIQWLSAECLLPVSMATSGEVLQPGRVYFPPENRHLEVTSSGRAICSLEPPYLGHRPSVTVTFNSIAKAYGKKAIGVLLTGMGKDGAAGMQAISQSGGITIAQDEATCAVFGMPKEAIKLGAVRHILPIQTIGNVINRSILSL